MQSLCRTLTLPHPRHTLSFQFAGKGSGEGRENRPRSRHCNRLNEPQARLPSRAAEASAFREKKRSQVAPRCLAGLFCLGERFALVRGDLCRHGKTHEKILGREARQLRCCSAPHPGVRHRARKCRLRALLQHQSTRSSWMKLAARSASRSPCSALSL